MSFRVHDTHEYLKKASQHPPQTEEGEKSKSSSSLSSSTTSSSDLRRGTQPSGMKIKTSDNTALCDYF